MVYKFFVEVEMNSNQSDISWERALNNAILSYYFKGCETVVALKLINTSMQRTCPGPYSVVMENDIFCMKVDDTPEGIMWRLKW